MRVEQLVAAGLYEDGARRETIRRFGELHRTREYCQRQTEEKEKNMRRRLALGDLMHDARIAVRGLARMPVLALTIAGSVGLGIGAAAAMFAIVDAALLRPLPYAKPEQLVRIFTDTPPYRFRFSV